MQSPPAGSFLRQPSGTAGMEAWRNHPSHYYCNTQMEDGDFSARLNPYGGGGGGGLVMRKRVMVVVDQSSHSKHAMIWALTHVVNKADLLTLLHIIPPSSSSAHSSPSLLANSLGSLCKACKPEVEVEALVVQGPKLATVMSQVKKLDVAVLVLGQKKPSSSIISCLCGRSRSEQFVEQCISNLECMTVGVRKQSKGMSGYLISTKRQKNFWLLA